MCNVHQFQSLMLLSVSHNVILKNFVPILNVTKYQHETIEINFAKSYLISTHYQNFNFIATTYQLLLFINKNCKNEQKLTR